MTLLQQSPYPLAIVGLCVAVMGLAVWQNGRRGAGLLLTLAGLLTVPMAWAIDRAFETDAERIEQRLTTVVSDYQTFDLPAVQDAISRTRPDLKALAAVAIEYANYEDERLTDVSVDVDGDEATAHFRLNANFLLNSGNLGEIRQPTRWRFGYVREGTSWKIVEVTELDPITGEELDRYRRHLRAG